MKKRRARRPINLRTAPATASDGLHDIVLALRRGKRRLQKESPVLCKKWAAHWANHILHDVTWLMLELIGKL
jgi:hypothetical protein